MKSVKLIADGDLGWQPRFCLVIEILREEYLPMFGRTTLLSPPLVVAYALAGTMDIDLINDPIGSDSSGSPVFLKDIWPSSKEVAELVESTVTREAFNSKYADVFKGDEKWQSVETTASQTYDWPISSTYVQNPPISRIWGKNLA